MVISWQVLNWFLGYILVRTMKVFWGDTNLGSIEFYNLTQLSDSLLTATIPSLVL